MEFNSIIFTPVKTNVKTNENHAKKKKERAINKG